MGGPFFQDLGGHFSASFYHIFVILVERISGIRMNFFGSLLIMFRAFKNCLRRRPSCFFRGKKKKETSKIWGAASFCRKTAMREGGRKCAQGSLMQHWSCSTHKMHWRKRHGDKATRKKHQRGAAGEDTVLTCHRKIGWSFLILFKRLNVYPIVFCELLVRLVCLVITIWQTT